MNDPQNREETAFEAVPQLPPKERAAQLGEICAASIVAALMLFACPMPASADCPLTVADWGNITEPPPVTLSNVVAISAGAAHGLALKSDGTVAAWGDNSAGQTAVPAIATNVTAISAGELYNLALRADGCVVGWGDNSSGQASPPASLASVVAIAAGSSHSLALKTNGTVVAWGNNFYGQANVPTNLVEVTAIAAGNGFSLALKGDGTVVAWGETDEGVVPAPAVLNGVAAIAAGYDHALALRTNGAVVGWGDNGDGQATPPPGLTGVVAVAAGAYYSLALKDDGTVVGWGDNYYGESESNVLSGVVAIAAGGNHNLALSPAPVAPLNFTLQTVATHQINLSWLDPSAGADSFKIERAPDVAGLAGTWSQIGATAAGITNFSDSTVISNVTYWYRVRAHSDCGDSIHVSPISVAVTVPSAPYSLSASVGISNKVEVFWYENFGGVIGSKVERAPNVAGIPGSWTEIATVDSSGSAESQYADEGVGPNTTNWYRVRAFNGIGISTYSSAIRANIIPPDAPSNLVAVPFPEHVGLSWNDGFPGVKGFKIERAPDQNGVPGAWSRIGTTNPTNVYQGSYSDPAVASDQTYWYRVQAFNWVGDSPFSPPAAVGISPPDGPTNLIAANDGWKQITLKWVDADKTVTGFVIERAPNHAGSPGAWNPIADVPPSTQFIDAGLELNTTYWYRVRACNNVGNSPFSNVAGAFVRDGQFVRVMQWNVERNLGRQANNGSFYAQCIARIINFNQPDILLFNEIDTESLTAAQNLSALTDWVTNNLPYLGQQPGATFYVAVSSQSDGYIRNAAIGRYPLLSETTYNDGLRGLHSFTVQLSASNALQVFHAHLKCCSDNCAEKQAEAQFDTNIIGAFAATNSLPYIFGGDWNEDEESQPPVCTLSGTYHPITTIREGCRLGDFKPTTLSGEYRTWSSQDATPSIRFDYVLSATNRLAPVSGYVFSSPDWSDHGQYNGLYYDSAYASDHYCVFANYFFPGPFQNWQKQFFGGSENASASPDADPDGDGLSNFAEFLAGTNPTNNASVLRIISVTVTNSDALITWSTAGGRTNVLQAASSLADTFSNISTSLPISGSGDIVTNYVDAGAATNDAARFYRILLPP